MLLLSWEVLKAHSIGPARVRDEWILHYVQTRNVVDREVERLPMAFRTSGFKAKLLIL